jgi:hypothetical protein
MDKEWRRKAKLVSVVSFKNCPMIMFIFVGCYCSYGDEFVGT